MEKIPQTIDEVLIALDAIIANTLAENNFLGIFAYVYRRTTEEIKKGIEEKRFQNNKRMEILDVTFANLYISAYHNYAEGKPVSKAWQISFEARNDKITIIQHLMLGMNAHINLDLGLAAVKITDKEPIEELENDFMKVNEILAELTNEIQYKLGRVSIFMFLLDWIGQRKDEKIVNFSIKKAREQAWEFACDLVTLKGEKRQKKIEQVDEKIYAVGEVVRNPPSQLLTFVLKLIRLFETTNIKKVMDKLKN